jgi:hypothetical protein
VLALRLHLAPRKLQDLADERGELLEVLLHEHLVALSSAVTTRSSSTHGCRIAIVVRSCFEK